MGGLHRSGTTPLARWLGEHPDASSFRDTGVPADEGQHLQDVYEPARRYGGPGRFALDRRSYLDASSPLVSDANRERLWRSWKPHWDLDRRLLVEKSPPNMVRMPFLDALFPGSHFITVVRHPLAVAYATKKWTRRPITSLVENWVTAHRRSLSDSATVRRATFVRYEDLVTHPDEVMREIFEFVGLKPFVGDWDVRQDINAAYLRDWDRGSLNPLKAARKRRIQDRYAADVEAWGYRLDQPGIVAAPKDQPARWITTASNDL